MNISIPIDFFHIKYNESNNPSYRKKDILKNGANCQLFAYMFLHHFGFPFLTFRSSDLWFDQVYTRKVKKMKIFDLVLFNKTNDSYGAHVGVYIGGNKIFHLSKQIGYPIVWDTAEFKKYDKYKIVIGIKRLRKTMKKSV